MALYGIVSAGAALTGTTSDDTFSWQFASASSLTGSTIAASEGSDLIYLGTQGQTISGFANFVDVGTGLPEAANIGVAVFGSAGALLNSNSGVFVSGTLSGAVTVSGLRTSQQALRVVAGSYLQGQVGDDTIAFGDMLATMSSTSVLGGDGNDVIGTINKFSAGSTLATAGLLTGGEWSRNYIFGGNGNDTVVLQATGVAFRLSATTIAGGQGDDVVKYGGLGTAEGDTQITLGGGNDTFVGNFSGGINSASIAGGGGNDVINFNTILTAKSFAVYGDALNSIDQYDGNDSIVFTASDADLISSFTIQAGGGNDTIVLDVSGDVGTEGAADGLIQLQVGNDVFSAETGLYSALTIQGGAGNDVAVFKSAVRASFIQMGGDSDTVTFNIADITENTTTTVNGGTGADLINASAAVGGADITVRFDYDSAGDSNISTMDTISIGGDTTRYNFVYSAATVVRASFATASTNGTSIATASDGIVTFGNDGPSNFTARVELINANATAAGRLAFFNNSGNNEVYMFIQGGSAGITDDVLVRVGTAATISGGSITMNGANNFSATL